MTSRIAAALLLTAALSPAALACDTPHRHPAAWQWHLPPHFPVPKVPADNPMSEEKFQLGRRLFYDVRLSGNGSQSCASCHLQRLAFTDGRAASLGSTGEETARSAPTIANAAYHPTLTWANYSLVTLERHMLVPLFGENPVEMGLTDNNKQAVLQRLKDDADYPGRFAAVFGKEPEPVDYHNAIKAIAAFMRGVISADSRYDRYLEGKEPLSETEERGRKLFFSARAQCSQCHGSFNLDDQDIAADSKAAKTPFHNTGLYNLDGKGGFPVPNRGIFELSGKAADMGAFRAPSLRNVALTAPYMHDGSIATLAEVLDFYAGHGRLIAAGPNAGDGRRNPYKDPRVDRIDLTAQDKADLIAFLKSLTDETLLTDPRYSDPFAAAPDAQP